MAIPGEVLSRSVLGFVRSGVLCVCLLTVRRKQKRLEVCTHVRQPAQACMHYRVRRVWGRLPFFPLFMTLTSVQDASLSEEQREGET